MFDAKGIHKSPGGKLVLSHLKNINLSCDKRSYDDRVYLDTSMTALRAMNKMYIFQGKGKIFCVEFQRYPLKFHSISYPYVEKLPSYNVGILKAVTCFEAFPRLQKQCTSKGTCQNPGKPAFKHVFMRHACGSQACPSCSAKIEPVWLLLRAYKASRRECQCEPKLY